MRSLAWRLRAAALLSGGVFAVHQLRYLLVFGQESHQVVRGQGHAYLTLLMPAIVIVLTLCAASLVVAIVHSGSGACERPPPSCRRLWGLSSGLLLLAYVVQESLEGVLGPGHSAGLAAVAGAGGWVVLPLVIFVGLVIALLLRGAVIAVSRVALRAARSRPRRSLPGWRPAHLTPALSLESFARFLVGRGPPVVCR